MPNDGKVETVTEAPAEEVLPIGDAPFETTEEATAEPEEKTAEKDADKSAEEMAEEVTPGEEDAEKSEEKAEAEPEGDEVDRLIKDLDKSEEDAEPSNVQKRIDRLTAELKALKAENAKLQQKAPAEERKPYTDEQLAKAMMKAVENQDADLVRDIFAELRKNVKDELVKMYSDEKEGSRKQAEAVESEWEEVVDAYAKYADTKVPAIWPTSHKDLNLRDSTSMLYQVAMALYWSKDQSKAARYRGQPGGQKLAVADALTYLLRTKAGKTTDTKVKKLQKQLTKERMKKSPVSGVPGGEEKAPRKAQTPEDTLAEVIAERSKFQEERGH